MMETTRILGYDFICSGSYEKFAQVIFDEVSSEQTGLTNLITPNAHGINEYFKYPELNAFCQSSRYVFPDGQPIVWLSKIRGKKISQRFTGSDFFPVLFQKLKEENARCLFVVSNQRLAALLENEMPHAKFIVPSFFEMSDKRTIDSIGQNIAETIETHQIQFVFFGISEPKQGALAMAATEVLKKISFQKSCLFLFLGASYEFYFGLKNRAPVFFQKTGMEWFYRLLAEPRRMYKRYIFGNLSFLIKALRWILNPGFGVNDKKL